MKRSSFRVSSWMMAAVAAAILPAACAGPDKRVGPVQQSVQARIIQATYPVLHDTVGERAAFIDGAPIKVEGWGIVANLPHTGSGDADPRIRELLVNNLLKSGVGMWSTGTQNINPEAILASDEISVVEVRGLIPPLARKGSAFDLYINALPDSQTTSLANGLLWTSELKQVGLTLAGNDTRTIALGRGPVFIPSELESAVAPATQPAQNARAKRSGRVIAGGVVQEDRQARLQVYTPDFGTTALIERVINARFPSRDKVAAAQDQSFINLRVPAEYADNPVDFVDLVRHLYLKPDEPGFNQAKAAEIIEALKNPDSPHRDLGLALQGLGRSILPDYIQPNYTSSNVELRFWCARAGACMQDVQGLTALEEMVKDRNNPLRRQALLAMVEASRGRDTARATVALYDLLNSTSSDDRILAYHALLAIRSRAITTYNVGRKFLLDLVPADSPPLIYVLEADSPRIAFIGRPLEIPPGALYISSDKYLTVTADLPTGTDEQDATLTAAAAALGVGGNTAILKANDKEPVMLYWRSPTGDRTVTLRSGKSLAALIARATWIPDPLSRDYDPKEPYIGASYQRITEMLAGMCQEKVMTAQMIVQHAPDALMSPTDIALSSRPEGSTAPPPPPPQTPLPDLGAPPKP